MLPELPRLPRCGPLGSYLPLPSLRQRRRPRVPQRSGGRRGRRHHPCRRYARRTEDVVQAARHALAYWDSSSDEAVANRYEEQVARAWRNALERKFPGRLDFEVEPVPGEHRSRIDAVDFVQGVAYEFKVSGKNPHHRFFRDLWKVVALNAQGGATVRRLVFVVGKPGDRELADAFTSRVREVAAQALGIEIEIVGVLPPPMPFPSFLDD